MRPKERRGTYRRRSRTEYQKRHQGTRGHEGPRETHLNVEE